MTKAREVVVDALELLVVQADEATISPNEAVKALRVLNDMMFAWDALGVSLGFTQVSGLGEILTVPPGAIRGIKANLAIDLAPMYEVPVSPALERKAKAGYDACLALSVQMAASKFPSTLPRGSGNSDGVFGSTFYDNEQDTILTETGGSIALEDDTEES